MRFAIAQIFIGCMLLLAAVFAGCAAYLIGHAVLACGAVVCGAVGAFLVAEGDGDLQDLLDEQEESVASHQ